MFYVNALTIGLRQKRQPSCSTIYRLHRSEWQNERKCQNAFFWGGASRRLLKTSSEEHIRPLNFLELIGFLTLKVSALFRIAPASKQRPILWHHLCGYFTEQNTGFPWSGLPPLLKKPCGTIVFYMKNIIVFSDVLLRLRCRAVGGTHDSYVSIGCDSLSALSAISAFLSQSLKFGTYWQSTAPRQYTLKCDEASRMDRTQNSVCGGLRSKAQQVSWFPVSKTAIFIVIRGLRRYF